MAIFSEKIRLKGKAEEDLFFAKLDLELIAALHKKHDKEELEQELEETLRPHSYQR